MDLKQLQQELEYKAVRSGGPGGQHANKTSSKVIVHFNVQRTKAFSEDQRQRLMAKLQHRLTNDGELILSCDTYRSQHKNKALVTDRLLGLLREQLQKRKKRKKNETVEKGRGKTTAPEEKTSLEET